MKQVHAEVTVEVAASPEAVFDFTQDYARRAAWDPAVREARVEAEGPERLVWVRGQGFTCRFRYKQYDRPARTSLAMVDVRSALFAGGGGSWSYEAAGAGTRWTQSNTLVFRNAVVGALLGPLARWGLARGTRRAMERAKTLLEQGR